MNSTVHTVTPEEIMAFLDGELPPAEAATLADHLTHCVECTGIADQFRGTARALAGWSIPATSARLDEAWVERRIRAGTTGKDSVLGRLPRPINGRWMPVALGGGALALALAATLLFMAYPFPASAPSPSAPEQERPLSARARLEPESVLRRPIAPPPQIAGVAGMAAPVMMKADGAPPSAYAMKAAQAPFSRMSPATALPRGGTSTSSPAPMIARTVGVDLRVRDVAAARPALDRIVAAHHGYSAQLTFAAGETGSRTLEASLRVPFAELAATLAELKTLGIVEGETQSGEEVSQQHQDLVARLKNSRATEERFRAILQQHTGNVSDILEVEQAIATVRGEIEGMEAEQEALEHRVDFATVNLQLVEPGVARRSSPPFFLRLHDAFVLGYRNASESLLVIVLFFAEYGLLLLLWVVLLGVPATLLWRRYRRIRAAQ